MRDPGVMGPRNQPAGLAIWYWRSTGKGDSLAKEIYGQEAAAEAIERTPLKGFDYEEQIVAIVQDWARPIGAQVYHVGPDNRPGDVVVKIDESAPSGIPLAIAIEVRDRQSPAGRLVVSNDVAAAMAQRNATMGIYLSRTRDGFAKEIGEWAEVLYSWTIVR